MYINDHNCQRTLLELSNFFHQKVLYFKQPEISKKINDLLPQEVILKIFSYLNCEGLTRCLLVNKKWNLLASNEELLNILLARIIFGKKQWETYFGDIDQEPALPKNIHHILGSPCPFWPEKSVEETHMLVLIPETVNQKPLNLETLGELVKAPKKGHATRYRLIYQSAIAAHNKQPATKRHWVLMTKGVIKNSKNKSYKDQQALITALAKQTGIKYEVPNVLDTIVCIFTRYISFEECLFPNQQWIYTWCQEQVPADQQVVVGGLSSKGLEVCAAESDLKSDNIGMTAMWKLP